MKVLLQFAVLLLIIPCTQAVGQEKLNCSILSRTRVQNPDTETTGQSFNSKDFYYTLIEKTVDKKDKTKPPIYSILLSAASKVLLSDSMLSTKGTIHLVLQNGSTLLINKVKYANNPVGYCCMLGFSAEVEEETIKAIGESPFVTLTIKEVDLTTTYAPKKQTQAQKICKCLLVK
jgi:hypothetical protein